MMKTTAAAKWTQTDPEIRRIGFERADGATRLLNAIYETFNHLRLNAIVTLN